VNAAVAQGQKHLGGFDGLVNAAGILAVEPVLDTEVATWRRILDVNFMGPNLVCRAMLPELMKHPGATVVNICSTVSMRPFPKFAAYSASKAALLSLTRSLAMELAPKVRVNAICPGPIRTPMNQKTWDDPSLGQSEAAAAGLVAMGRVGEPDEIASAALYLTTSDSSYVNGESLVVDGGQAFW
jgi:3-oxoacyl-[acyl-carrier protein] reductase